MQEAIGLVLDAQLALDGVVVCIVVGSVAEDVLGIVGGFAVDGLMAELLLLHQVAGGRSK